MSGRSIFTPGLGPKLASCAFRSSMQWCCYWWGAPNDGGGGAEGGGGGGGNRFQTKYLTPLGGGLASESYPGGQRRVGSIGAELDTVTEGSPWGTLSPSPTSRSFSTCALSWALLDPSGRKPIRVSSESAIKSRIAPIGIHW